MSLDGYIAKPDGDISFLSVVEKDGEDYGYSDFIKTIDTVIVGRRTYDKILTLGFQYPREKEIYIITHNPLPGSGLKHYSGPLTGLIEGLRSREGKNIFCDGGSEIINELLNDNLIDEFVISIIPVILGDGIPLFRAGIPLSGLKLEECRKFDTGLVQLNYIRHRS